MYQIYRASTPNDVILVNNEKTFPKSLLILLSLSDHDLVLVSQKVNHHRFKHKTFR